MRGDKDLTSIPLKRETQRMLKNRKVHPNQSYDEVIVEIMEKVDGLENEEE